MKQKLKPLFDQANEIYRGKSEVVELCLTSIFAGGHILLEDVPGVGKTTLVKLMAKICGLKTNRIQFTNDILPSDVLGHNVFVKDTGDFRFHPGPIFGQVILADELNRAPSRSQSALLQSMEEAIVTIDGQSYDLPKPFIVMATQNPRDQIGTNPLPESQLDRFLIKLSVGFPNAQDEIEILKGVSRLSLIENLEQVLNSEDIIKVPTIVKEEVLISNEIYRYTQSLLNTSRELPESLDLSPRCGIDLIKASACLAWIRDMKYVTPDIVQYLFPYVAGHRLVNPQNSHLNKESELANLIISSTHVI